jgi:5-methylthioadenosine/S-adenosylhomocysteine deaminase
MDDLVLHNGTAVTVNPAFEILPHAVVAIRQGRLRAVTNRVPGTPLPSARETLDAGGGLILPGLVNAHTHLPMTLFRGLADDLPLKPWLEEHIFPAEARFMDPVSVGWGARLACCELLLSGTTTCCDGYFHADAVAGAVVECGLRAVLGQGVLDFPAPGVPDPREALPRAREFLTRWRGVSPLVRPSLFCHAAYTCGPETLTAAKAAAEEAGALYQIHAAETRSEARELIDPRAPTPVGHLARLGLLDPRTLLAHCVWVEPWDIEAIRAAGAGVVHCPESNMKLAAGIAPLPALLAAGIPVGLGTDGCASNNDLDLFREMGTAARLHKVAGGDPTTVSAREVLTMATIGGARALGLADRIGSLEPGKEADIIVVDTRRPALTPLYRPESHLVYAADGAAVRDVIVAGRLRVRGHRLVDLDLERIMAEVRALARRIRPPLCAHRY